MDVDEPGWPLLDDFFMTLAEGRRPETVRRYARIRDRLHLFLDTETFAFDLGPQADALLDAEREFHDSGAFWVLYGTEELCACLPGFLGERWLPDSTAQATTQVSVVSRLLEHVRDHGTVSSEVYWSTARAVVHARHAVKIRAAARRFDEGASGMPARFRQAPGPHW